MALSMTTEEVEAVVMGNGTWAHTSVQSDDPSSDLLLPVLNFVASRRCPFSTFCEDSSRSPNIFPGSVLQHTSAFVA